MEWFIVFMIVAVVSNCNVAVHTFRRLYQWLSIRVFLLHSSVYQIKTNHTKKCSTNEILIWGFVLHEYLMRSLKKGIEILCFLYMTGLTVYFDKKKLCLWFYHIFVTLAFRKMKLDLRMQIIHSHFHFYFKGDSKKIFYRIFFLRFFFLCLTIDSLFQFNFKNMVSEKKISWNRQCVYLWWICHMLLYFNFIT